MISLPCHTYTLWGVVGCQVDLILSSLMATDESLCEDETEI